MNLQNNKIIKYIVESKRELKKVAWPTKQETTKHTILVIAVSLATAVFLGAVDFLLSKGFEKLIK